MTEADMDSEPLLSQSPEDTYPMKMSLRDLRTYKWKKRLKTLGIMGIIIIASSLYLLASPSLTIHDNQICSECEVKSTNSKTFMNSDIVPTGYLIWSSGCRIPDVDPFGLDAMKLFHPKTYHKCSKDPTFTYIEDTPDGEVVLKMNTSVIDTMKKGNENVSCCYSNITRSTKHDHEDTDIVYSTCKKFTSYEKLLPTEEFIIVRCNIQHKSMKWKKRKTVEVHTNVQPSAVVKKRFKLFESNTSARPWNVLMIGVDTLSRINLIRAMPKTYSHLKGHHWLDFQAYNKIDDNTFPNLMAFLTGRNNSRARIVCDGVGNDSPDNCDFMWKQYQNVGYVTAYAEDHVGIDTFGKPLHKGFVVPPADHYLRPLFIAAEKSVTASDGYKHFCAGQLSSGETIFNYASRFVQTYKNDPFFGFFWMNTFSHDDAGNPASMDSKMETFLTQLMETEAYNNTFIFFLGDHGIRFGEIRSLLTGYYEERLPALFISVPPKFQETFPELYSMMILNTKRLTTPYDVFMTLQDILRVSGRRDVLRPSEACPDCQSLFVPIDYDRSCSDCSVTSHWCACNPLQSMPSDYELAKRSILYLLDNIIENDFAQVNTNSKCRLCAKLNLSKIQHVYKVQNMMEIKDYEEYVIVFTVNPGKMTYETTVRHYLKTDTIELEGIVSRLTTYSGSGECVKSAYLKKYCFCNKKCYSKQKSPIKL